MKGGKSSAAMKRIRSGALPVVAKPDCPPENSGIVTEEGDFREFTAFSEPSFPAPNKGELWEIAHVSVPYAFCAMAFDAAKMSGWALQKISNMKNKGKRKSYPIQFATERKPNGKFSRRY